MPSDISDLKLDIASRLHKDGWQQYFDRNSLERGLRFARQQRATLGPMGNSRGTLLLSGSVKGNQSTYKTRAFIPSDDEDTGIVTLCSCPVGRNCKHGVALLQTLLEKVTPGSVTPGNTSLASSTVAPETPSLNEYQWQYWLDALTGKIPGAGGPQLPGKAAKTVADECRLALFLHVDRPSRPTLCVTPVWLRPSRSRNTSVSRWVKPEPITLDHSTLTPAPSDGWPDQRLDTLLLLLSQPYRHRHIGSKLMAMFPLESRIQQRAFKKLLDADEPPLLFHDKQTGQPLEYAPERSIDMAWQVGRDGLQHPIAVLDGTPVKPDTDKIIWLTIGDTLWHLDLGQGYIGPLDGDPRLFTQLKHAPGLAPEKARWLAEKLQALPDPPAQLKVPEPPEQRTLENVTPTLAMQMQALELHQPRSPKHIFPIGIGVLRLDYEGIKLSPDSNSSKVRVQHGNELIDIVRDTATEKALFRELPSGMAPLLPLLKQSPPAYLMIGPHDDPQLVDPGSMALLRDEQLPASIDDWPEYLAAPNAWWPMIHELRQQGVEVSLAEDFPPEPTYVTPDAWYGELDEGDGGWFTLSLDIELDGERINLLPLLGQLLDDRDFPLEPAADEPEDATWPVALGENRYAVLPRARLRELMAPIMDWLRDDPTREQLSMPVTEASHLDALARQERWEGRENVAQLATALRELPDTLPAPEGFNGSLRPYQAEGMAWLRFLATLNVGGILADDMGLGKTVQVLAHILDERHRGALAGPVLIVATTSLVGNWLAETERFAPMLTPLALTGDRSKRERLFEQIDSADIVITTYPLLIRDIETLTRHAFALAVFDEAQAIKNPAAQAAKAVRALDARRRLALTGTPLENHLGELWAEIDAVTPGFLGDQRWFGQRYRRPIEQHGDSEVRARLLRRIRPLLLRRTKGQVLTELPEKTEVQRNVELTGKQRELYESLRLAQHERVRQSIEKRGLAQSGIVMLDALLKLRQACCDPRLVKLDSARRIQRSAKLELLRELVPALIEEQRHILVFSQFTEMLDLIANALKSDGIEYLTLTGQTPRDKRAEAVAQFQRGDIPVFLISLKAGGVGLNLTRADTVIHYDPWWNPAVEAQATGRAHRIGQENPVFVYKLVASGTVEERIVAMQAGKAALASSILAAGSDEDARRLAFDEEDLADLFAPMDG